MSRLPASAGKKPNGIVILVASVLKPIRDIRHYHKLSWALGRHLPEARFYFAGYGLPQAANEFSLFRGRRLSFARLGAVMRFLRLLWRLRPRVVMVCALELLPFALLYRLLSGAYLILDLQENYEANVKAHEGYRFRFLWAWMVRACYRLLLPRVQCILYAEACYAEEIPSLRKHPHALCIANKVRRHAQPAPVHNPFRLVLTGTLSSLFGLFEAVALCRRLHALDSRYHLVLAGQLSPALTSEALRLLEAPFIDSRHVSFQPVAYDIIEATLRAGGVGLMLYHPKKSIACRVPTKLYEYLSWHMPIIGTAHPFWQSVANQYADGLYYGLVLEEINEAGKPEALHRWLMQPKPTQASPRIFFEVSEAPKLKPLARHLRARYLPKP